jgi:plastocyanin
MKARIGMSVAALAFVALTVASCGKKESEEGAPATTAQPAAPAQPVDAATAGSVSGTVKLDGAAPKPRRINMAAEPACASAHPGGATDQEVVASASGELANVVVYVKEGLGNRTFDVPKQSVELDQKGCLYTPHVVALMAGQQLDVKNGDPTTHNIHPVPKNNPEWNVSQPPGAPDIQKVFAREELSIPVKCNVHPWMKSYIAVFKHPYFAVTGANGSFDLKNLPPGTYTIEAWHEKYGTTSQSVTIGPKEAKTVSFTFKATAAGD